MRMFFIRGMMTAILLATCVAFAEDEYAVLDAVSEGFEPRRMMQEYLDDQAQAMFERRRLRYESLKTPEDIAQYQTDMRAFFVDALGGFPERTPLNVQHVGSGSREDFRYEKIIYESQPGYFVTAILYLPVTPGPYPAVLVPCGHSSNGKAAESYQKACILLARNGIAALCYDPVGQGERYYYFDEKGKPVNGTTMHHLLADTGAILTGTNMAMYAIWDGMRGIDYLQSRDDIDGERIGCTGNSGGGTLTSHIMALDDRVKVAAPSCYITSFPRLLATIGPQDAEQVFFGQLAFGMDHADYIHMRAPKPTLICAATQDFFDIEGTWDTFREAKRLYTRLGYAERVDLVEVDAKHGFSQPLREAMVRWMRRWLMGIDEPVFEESVEIFSDEELQCTPDGQVINLDGVRTTFDLNRERGEKLAASREAFMSAGTARGRRESIRALIGAAPFSATEIPKIEKRGKIEREGYSIEKLALIPEPGIVLPALFFRPTGNVKRAIVYLHGEDKAVEAGPEGRLEKWAQEGTLILAVDLRGIGETESHEYKNNWKRTVGSDWPDFMRAYLQGRTVVGMRVEDIFSATRYIQSVAGDDVGIRLIAQGESTVPALHAAALAPSEFEQVTLEKGIPSWMAVVKEPHAADQLVNVVHGALRRYDLPDLVSLAAPGTIRMVESKVPVF